jgi:hypothetical protein
MDHASLLDLLHGTDVPNPKYQRGGAQCPCCDGRVNWRVYEGKEPIYHCNKGCKKEAIEAAIAKGQGGDEPALKPSVRAQNGHANGNGNSHPAPTDVTSHLNGHTNGNGKIHRPPSKLGHAIAYARKGIRVFPLHEIESDGECSCGKLRCPSAGKHPRLKDWQRLATLDEDQLAAWWRDWPNANIGIKCGVESNLTVLDVDGDEGRESLRALELEHGELPLTPIAITGRGGAHYLFAFEPGLQNAVKFTNGLDVRTEGGLVVGVGSKTVGPYLWEAAFTLGEIELATMPQWLGDQIRAAGPSAHRNGALVVPEKIPSGERNNWLYKTTRSLKAKGLSAQAIESAVLIENAVKCIPPMEIEEVRAIVAHATTQPDQKNFQPTNGQVPAIVDPYEERQAIDAFAAYERMVGDNREYSVAGLCRDGCTMILSALIGAGKTTLAMNFARSWGLGVPILGRACRQSKTLVVVSPKEFEAWADTIGFWKLKGLIYLVESTKAHFAKSAETIDWFDYTMRKHDCRTFILDTLFDFFGMPPNTSGDSNRIAMNEQTPFLQMVRERNYSGLATGHAPKSEANAIAARDPEEAFGGHTAWTAQHRMRMSIRRKSQGVNAFITGRGGYGDEGILKEEMLLFNKETRLVSLGGLFSEYLGATAASRAGSSPPRSKSASESHQTSVMPATGSSIPRGS